MPTVSLVKGQKLCLFSSAYSSILMNLDWSYMYLPDEDRMDDEGMF